MGNPHRGGTNVKQVLTLALVALLVVSSTGFALAQDPELAYEPTADDLANARGFSPGYGVEVRALQMAESAAGEPVVDCGLLAVEADDIVVAWEVSRGANPADYATINADLVAAGFTVCTIDMAETGGIPVDTDILVITSFALGRGPLGNGCLNGSQYTTSAVPPDIPEVDKIWKAVSGGMGLLLLNENEFCGWGTSSVATRLGVIPAGDKWSYTFSAGPDYNANNPAALFNDVTSWEVDLATSYSLIYPPALAVAWNDADKPAVVTKQQQGGCAVIVGDSNWFADYPFDPPQIPFVNRLDARTLANNAFGFLENCGLWADPDGPYFGSVGSLIEFHGTGFDPRGEPITSYTWDFGDGVSVSGTDTDPTHAYAAAGDYAVCLTVSTDSGRTDTNCTTAHIVDTNTAPSLTVNQAALTVDEGQTASNSGTVSDEKVATVNLDATVGSVTNNRDGSWSWSLVTVDGPANSQVVIIATDENGEQASVTFNLIVNNVAPTVEEITIVGGTVIEAGTSIDASADFTDPGILDTHTAMWDWGEGAQDTVTLAQGNRLATRSHTYTTAGIYTIQVMVTDKDGGFDQSTFQHVIVYDRSEGFVTGSGKFDWPSDGASALGVGNTQFSVVAKYLKGDTVPTGGTSFISEPGELDFESSSYEWLVVTGGNYAMLKGTGTINGTGNYQFRVWAGDGGPDTFTIRIWDEDEFGNEDLIYENDMDQPITSGNVVIHDNVK